MKSLRDVFETKRKTLAVNENRETYIAPAAYEANVRKVLANIELLRKNVSQHAEDYRATKLSNWGYAGDMERLNEQLTEINEWLGNGVDF